MIRSGSGQGQLLLELFGIIMQCIEYPRQLAIRVAVDMSLDRVAETDIRRTITAIEAPERCNRGV